MGLRNGAYVYGKYRCWSMVNVKGCIVSLGYSEDQGRSVWGKDVVMVQVCGDGEVQGCQVEVLYKIREGGEIWMA
jgi:hypothetical protein